ncbi:MAG: glycosyltransferase family 2 protein, partial [Planctomycetes bacterium]|nr:glycosyltransferase family 2 protein [Planctomycetota bacterium]
MKISAIIITHNEEDRIGSCLQALSWCDEIIVIDSGSTDNTITIAKQYGVEAIHHPFAGFGAQKQFAVSQTHHNWVLNVDADEIISEELKSEITALDENSDVAGWNIPFQTEFMGTVLKYGTCRSEKHLRLFNKNKGDFDASVAHEKVLLEGKVSQLGNHILHHPYRDMSHYITKLNLYTSSIAQTYKDNNKTCGIISIFFK